MKAVLGAMAGAVIAALALTALPAHAQEGKAAQKLEERFAAADKDHDGKLTKAEAQAGMPRVAKHFDEIDTQKTGAVTLEQVKQFAAAQMKDRKK
ncbi:EF-hand domain-containing protein [Roseateles aquatilis]|uniref:EF-hand domain-containing protein n=1 Tax=Roseateles aquatilis TaxID=431061 RepID=UPI000B4C58C6|nr:EF-hand domain-containing protein [Roseateles aquatilis]